nr:MAG TPA: protein of unknown function (DUF4491) [Caudoviricetes sp.]
MLSLMIESLTISCTLGVLGLLSLLGIDKYIIINPIMTIKI